MKGMALFFFIVELMELLLTSVLFTGRWEEITVNTCSLPMEYFHKNSSLSKAPPVCLERTLHPSSLEYHQAWGHLAPLLHCGFSRTPWMAFVWDGLGHCPAEEEEKPPETEVKGLRTQPAPGQPLGISNGNIFAKRIFSESAKCVFPHQSQFVGLQF